MIYSNKKYLNIESYDEKMQKVFKYLEDNKLEDFDSGSYEIDGTEVFVNIINYTTKNEEERFWEAHREYLDVHYIFSGQERINLAFIDKLSFKEYKADEDFVSMEGEKSQSIILEKDDFLILYPEDVHMTCLKVKESELVKKAVFKVKI